MSWEYIDGTAPASLRTPKEAARIKKADEKRARGDYSMRLQRSTPNTVDLKPVEDTAAWATYQYQLARGLGDSVESEKKLVDGWTTETTGNMVKEIRANQSITLAELSIRSGVAVGTICRFEAEMPCRNGTKQKIIIGLGVPWSRRFEVFPV